MNTHDLLERRAERGAVRGAANVWSGAQPDAAVNKANHRSRSTVLFRFALLAWTLVLLAVVLTPTGSKDVDTAASSDADLNDPDPNQTVEPLPAPLLINGGTLSRNHGRVIRPSDPGFDADDVFDDNVLIQGANGELAPSISIVVFADPEDPFDGPILGLELFDGGGFRPWGANTTDAELASFTNQLIQAAGAWSMPTTSGLVEVARFQDNHENPFKLGWQFNFGLSGHKELTLQAETREADQPLSEWVWVARLARQEQTTTVVKSIDVLGYHGLVIETDRGGDDRSYDGVSDDGVVWYADGFIYRMMASELIDNTSFGRDSTQDIARLRVVDRSEWVDAVSKSYRTSGSDWLVEVFGLLLVVGLLTSTIWFLVRRSFQAAALTAGTLIAWLFFGTAPLGFGTILFVTLGIGLAWWWHHNQRQMRAHLSSLD